MEFVFAFVPSLENEGLWPPVLFPSSDPELRQAELGQTLGKLMAVGRQLRLRYFDWVALGVDGSRP